MATNIHSKQNSNTLPLVLSRILRFPEVNLKTGLCRSHIHQLVSKGHFPPPIKLTPNGRASGWVEFEVNAWLEQRIAESRSNSPAKV